MPHPTQGRGQPGPTFDRATIRQAIKVVLIGLAVLAVLIVLTFPTDSLVRSVVAKIPVPPGRAFTFAFLRRSG